MNIIIISYNIYLIRLRRLPAPVAPGCVEHSLVAKQESQSRSKTKTQSSFIPDTSRKTESRRIMLSYAYSI